MMGSLTYRTKLFIAMTTIDTVALFVANLDQQSAGAFAVYDLQFRVLAMALTVLWCGLGLKQTLLDWAEDIEPIVIYEEFAPKRKRIDPSGFIYLLKTTDGVYKIGHTKNPADRLRTFKVKLPFQVEYEKVIPAANRHQAEKMLHDKFSHRRMDGEWFHLDQADIDWIKGLEKL